MPERLTVKLFSFILMGSAIQAQKTTPEAGPPGTLPRFRSDKRNDMTYEGVAPHTAAFRASALFRQESAETGRI